MYHGGSDGNLTDFLCIVCGEGKTKRSYGTTPDHFAFAHKKRVDCIDRFDEVKHLYGIDSVSNAFEKTSNEIEQLPASNVIQQLPVSSVATKAERLLVNWYASVEGGESIPADEIVLFLLQKIEDLETEKGRLNAENADLQTKLKWA
jgi:hypothetical protein